MSVWLRKRRAGVRDAAETGEVPLGAPSSLMDDFASIKEQLEELGLFHEDTLVLLKAGENRLVLDAQGGLVDSPLFAGVHAACALFTHGPYAERYVQQGRPLRASTDDLAQMFGPTLACVTPPEVTGTACLVAGHGFVVTGRYLDELIAAAILVEKACRAELLAPQIGSLHYLNPALCALEHAVYRAAYSRHEREAHDG